MKKEPNSVYMPRQSREETLLRLLIELSDEKGHCNRELSVKLGSSEPRISDLAGELESDEFIYHSNRPSTNPDIKIAGSRYGEKPYYIGPQDPTTPDEKAEVFRNIFEKFVINGDLDSKRKFFESEYLTNLIKQIGLIKIYDIIITHLHDESFKKMASKALLSQEAVKEEYKNQINSFLEEGSHLVPRKYANTPKDLIGILPNFDLFTAIKFYRETIGDDYSKLYRKNSNYTNSGLRKFTDYDVYISPFTSYPRNNPADLLFKKPYERIYDDVYILNEADREKFVKRAHVVYSNFASMLLVGCIQDKRRSQIDLIDYKLQITEENKESKLSRKKYLINIYKYIETTIKLAIYYWNIASIRLDKLNELLKDHSKGSYYIKSNNTSIQIISLLDMEHLELELGNFSLLPGPIDPFLSLWPCKAFDEFDLSTDEIGYNDILHFVSPSTMLQA